MNVPETFPKEGKQSLANVKKSVTNLRSYFTFEYHHYLLLTSVPLARRVVAATPPEGGPMAVTGK